MKTWIVLIVYIAGVFAAYFQIQRWERHEATSRDEYQTLFMLSMLSWIIYPLYGIICLIRKAEEED